MYRKTSSCFDKETGLHYNYFRTYDPALGRYIESDPIGLGGGLNTYTYVRGNPLSNYDSFGLFSPGDHDLILERSLGRPLTPAELQILQQSSRDFDKRTQGAQDCPMHSMQCVGQSAEGAMAQRDDFIKRALAEAREMNKRRNRAGALRRLGEACHPIMDWSSPEHTDAQGHPKLWRGLRDAWGHSPNDWIGNETVHDVTPQMLERQRELLNRAYDSVFGK